MRNNPVRTIFCAVLVFVLATFSEFVCGQDITQIDGINWKIAHIIDKDATAPEVQVTILPAVVEWSDSGGKYAFYSLCDQLPQWGATLNSTDKTISKRYYQFLTGIKAKDADPKLDAKQRQAAADAQKVADQLKKDQDKMLSDWLDVRGKEAVLPFEQRTSYTEWKRKHGADVAGDEISYTAALSRWQKYVGQEGLSGVGKGLNDFIHSELTNVMTYSGVPESAYPCEPLIDIPAALANAKTHQGDPDLDLKFTHHTASKNESWDSWGGGGGWGPFSVDVHHERHDVHTDDTNFSLEFAAPVVIKFDVKRPWLDLDLISTYQNADIYPDSELKQNLPLWGKDGKFPLVSKTFIAAYHPKVTLRMGAADYRSFHESFTGGGSISVGPWHADINGTGGVNVENWDENSHTVIIGTSADTFVLLGVINKVLP